MLIHPFRQSSISVYLLANATKSRLCQQELQSCASLLHSLFATANSSHRSGYARINFHTYTEPKLS